jgi:hypothetical protein
MLALSSTLAAASKSIPSWIERPVISQAGFSPVCESQISFAGHEASCWTLLLYNTAK